MGSAMGNIQQSNYFFVKNHAKAMMCCSICFSVVLKYIVHTHTHMNTPWFIPE